MLLTLRPRAGLGVLVACEAHVSTAAVDRDGDGQDEGGDRDLGFGADRASAASAASASLSSGFAAAESSYTSGWHAYLSGKTVPASVSGDTPRRRISL